MLRQKKQSGKETTDKGYEDTKRPSNCIICLDKVSCRGKLSVCNHWFCFACVLEWSKNTNTCPICKARFRVITKIHLSPLKSPPQKVRVADKDQREWNDDETLTPDQIFAILGDDHDDFDDDYVPPYHVDNPWTRAGRMDEDNFIDEFDYDDSFIDDTDLPQEQLMDRDKSAGNENSAGSYTYDESANHSCPYALRSTRSSALLAFQYITSDDESTNNESAQMSEVESNEFSDTESDHSSIATSDSFIVNDFDSDEENNDWVPFGKKRQRNTNKTKDKRRTSKDALRIIPQFSTNTSDDESSNNESAQISEVESNEFSDIESDHSSIATSDSFIVNDFDSDEENNDWVPFGNKSQRNTRKTKDKKRTSKRSSLKHPSGTKKTTCERKTSSSFRRNKTNSKNQTTTDSKKKQKQLSSRRLEDADGWINMSRFGCFSETSLSKANTQTSTSGTKRRNKSPHSAEQSPNPRSSISGGDLGDESYNNSNFEELSLRAGLKRKKDVKSDSDEEDIDIFCAQPNKFKPKTANDMNRGVDTLNFPSLIGSIDYQSEGVIEPSPHVGKIRSIFTKRRHRSPANSFDDCDGSQTSLKMSLNQTGFHKSNNPVSDCTNAVKLKKNLMNNIAFESNNVTKGTANVSPKAKSCSSRLTRSSKQHTHHEEQVKVLNECCDNVVKATKKIKPKRKRIMLIDSDSD